MKRSRWAKETMIVRNPSADPSSMRNLAELSWFLVWVVPAFALFAIGCTVYRASEWVLTIAEWPEARRLSA